MDELLAFLTPLEWVIFLGIFLSSIVLIRFYIFYYANLTKKKVCTSSETEVKHPISIVISGKNEYDNLKENLPFWLSQNYPKFEIVVVYDANDDNILQLLQDFQQRYSQLKLVNFTQNVNFFDEQSFSISIGIKSAEYEYVIVSTADCRPTNEYYIDAMQMGISEQTDVLIGYSTYTYKPNFFNSFARFHLFQNSLQYLSFTLRGKTYAASHQNMIYRKDFFLEHKGYTSFYALKTGIYDLLASPLFNNKNIDIQLNNNSITKISGKLFANNWLKKELQYFSIIRNAPKKIALTIASYRTFTFLFYAFLFLGIYTLFLYSDSISTYKLEWLCICFVIIITKFTTQYYVIKQCMRKLNEKHFLLFIPLFEVLYLPLQLVLFFLRMMPQLKKWK